MASATPQRPQLDGGGLSDGATQAVSADNPPDLHSGWAAAAAAAEARPAADTPQEVDEAELIHALRARHLGSSGLLSAAVPPRVVQPGLAAGGDQPLLLQVCRSLQAELVQLDERYASLLQQAAEQAQSHHKLQRVCAKGTAQRQQEAAAAAQQVHQLLLQRGWQLRQLQAYAEALPLDLHG